LTALSKRLAPLATSACPFARQPRGLAHAHWVKPKLVTQVRFTEWTDDGSMRHPAFLGLRDDKRAADCHRDRPLPASEVA
jgi:bifunctional non-homologous end joining protein LigD